MKPTNSDYLRALIKEYGLKLATKIWKRSKQHPIMGYEDLVREKANNDG